MKTLRMLGLCLALSGMAPLLAQQTAPELEQARKEVDTLCSPYMGGRGYVNEGHKRAADYLEARFKEMGLKPAARRGKFQQKFSIEINLPTEAELTLNGDAKRVGVDYILHRASGSGKAEARVKDLGYAIDPPYKLKGKVAIFEAGFPEEIANDSERRNRYKKYARPEARIQELINGGASAIIIKKGKLTAGFGREVAPLPIIEVAEDSLPKRVRKVRLKTTSELTRIRTQNVVGIIEGTTKPDSFILLTAHYDHLGTYEDALFAGANDNASGTSMLLSMAEYFSKRPLDYSIMFIAFGGEETGLLGSRHFVYEDPRVDLSKVKFLLNLDLMGNGIDGIMAVGGRDFPDHFERLKALNDTLESVPVVRARPNAPNSDHFFFLREGVEGFFIYTLGGPPHYHDVNDNASTLVFSRFVEVRKLLLAFLEGIGKPQG